MSLRYIRTSVDDANDYSGIRQSSTDRYSTEKLSATVDGDDKKMHTGRLSYLDLPRRREVRNSTVTAGGAVQR